MLEIPGYKLVRTLGKGGMAHVYLAIQESFEREVALKVMSAALADDSTFTERFVREAKIVSQLVHPNIVTVYDVGISNNHHFLSMQYVPGDHLKSRLDSLTTEQRLQAVKDIAKALDYASKKGYVHRDVKPENIMLHEEDGHAVLMDFGIACMADSTNGMTQTGMAIGTPHYMSPEQAKGRKVDSRTDLYSLGVVLFLVLTNNLPYEADSAIGVGIKHVSEPIPQLPEHLKLFQPLINKAMAKHPDQRYQTGAEFIAALESITADDLHMMERLLEKEKSALLSPNANNGDDATVIGNNVKSASDISSPVRKSVEGKPRSNPKIQVTSDSNKGEHRQQTIATDKNLQRQKAARKAAMKRRAQAKLSESGSAEAIRVEREDRRLPAEEKKSGPWVWLTLIAAVLIISLCAPLYRDYLPASIQVPVDEGIAGAVELKNKTLTLLGVRSADNSPRSVVADTVPATEPTATVADNPGLLPDMGDAEAPTLVVNEGDSTAQLSADPKERARLLREQLPDDLSLAPEIAELYRTALEQNPQDQKAQWALDELLEFHLQEIREHLQERDLEQADIYLVSLTSIFPTATDDERYQKIDSRRQQIENANSAIDQAETYFAAGKLLAPKDGNAVMLFQAALGHDENNPTALQGLERVAETLRQRAEKEMNSGGFIKALEITNQGLTVNRNDSELIRLQQTISAKLERQRSIVNTLAQAQQQMTAKQYDDAYQRYQAVLKLDKSNGDAQRGLGDIEQQYVLDIERAINSNSFDQARSIIDHGRELFPRSQRWLGLEAALDQAVEADFIARQPKIPTVRVSTSQLNSLSPTQVDLTNVDRTIHIGFQYDNFTQETSVVQAILFDGGRSVQIAQVPVVVNGSGGVKFFKIDRPVEGFSAGGYNIDLLLDGDRLGSINFNVKRSADSEITSN